MKLILPENRKPNTMKFQIDPIGIFRCEEFFRYETPRQGAFAQNCGVIELEPEHGYEEAAADLKGFDRIWVLFLFHLNQSWNVKVTPPVAPPGRKIGVFATRSPHRPNRIGMSCVELDKIEGNKIFIRNFDLLDRTPIIDIKPYIPAADAFPASCTGWLEETEKSHYTVKVTQQALEKCALILAAGGQDLQKFCQVQLSYSPLDAARKRLTRLAENRWRINFRNNTADFEIDLPNRQVTVYDVCKAE